MKYLLVAILSFSFLLSSLQAQRVRRLLLFAGDTSNAELKLQREWLKADSAGVEERDIWIAVFANPKTFRRMYDHHSVDRDEFSLVLMGKDGTEKFRSEKPVPVKDLFDLIDAMPMRQAEIQEQRKSNNQHE